MGQRTRASIVSEGLQLAGNTGLTLRANVWLNGWLGSIAASADWKNLASRYLVNLAQGATSFIFGDSGNTGGGLTADKILDIKRLILFDTVNSGYKGDVVIVSGMSVNALDEPAALDPGSPGTPLQALVEHVDILSGLGLTPDAFVIRPIPIPDKAYRMGIVALKLPVNIDETSAGDNQYPWYLNDQTMIQAVYTWALAHQDDERWTTADALLGSMVKADRAKYAPKPGSNRVLLSTRVFRSPSRIVSGWPWPGGP